jgi:hypothetical protein
MQSLAPPCLLGTTCTLLYHTQAHTHTHTHSLSLSFLLSFSQCNRSPHLVCSARHVNCCITDKLTHTHTLSLSPSSSRSHNAITRPTLLARHDRYTAVATVPVGMSGFSIPSTRPSDSELDWVLLLEPSSSTPPPGVPQYPPLAQDMCVKSIIHSTFLQANARNVLLLLLLPLPPPTPPPFLLLLLLALFHFLPKPTWYSGCFCFLSPSCNKTKTCTVQQMHAPCC